KADRVEKYTYDTNGYLVKTNINADGSTDGSIDETITYTNNAQGESVKIEYDYNPSNPANPQTDKADRIEYLVRDGNGVVVEKFVDSDGDSTTGHNHNKPALGDKNLPGSLQGIDRIESYVIDGQGQITEARYNFDGNNKTGDTVGNTQGVDQVDYIVRDAHGRETDRYRNLDAKISSGQTKTLSDGRTVNGIDNSTHRALDAKGNIYKTDEDRNADGKADYTEFWQRDPDGAVTDVYINRDGKDGEATGKNQTMNVDGKEIQIQGIDAHNHRELDANNRILSESRDYNNDGSPEFIEHREYNANGHYTGRYTNSDGKDTGTTQTINGKEVQGIEKVETIDTNARGNWLKVEYNNDADKGGNNGEGVTDAITYNVVDANGRVVARYTDSDGQASGKTTGETINVMIDGKEVTLTGIDRIDTFEYNANGQLIQQNRNLDAKGQGTDKEFEEVSYYDRDEYGREKGVYTDLDNSKATGTGAKDGGEAITLRDGRVLNGVDTYHTHEHNAAGQIYQINRNRDAKGEFEDIEYRDINSQTGQADTIYYNRDNDRDPTTGEALAKKSGNTFEITVDGQTKTIEGIDAYNEYIRNDNNQVIEERFNFDADANKQIDRIYYYDLDANGRRIGEYQNLDNNTAAKPGETTGNTFTLNDGRTLNGIERAYFKEYNANGQAIKTQSNLDGDTKGITEGQVGTGQIESTIYVEVDSAGREIKRYENVDNDTLPSGKANPTGKDFTVNGELVKGLDKVTTHVRDGNGNIVKTTVEEFGNNGELKRTLVTTITNNERNQRIADETQVTKDGSTNQQSANEYTYDIYGRKHTQSIENNSQKAGFERVETYHYDAYGRISRIERDLPGDEVKVNNHTTYERDSYGNSKVEKVFALDLQTSHVVKEYNQYAQLSKMTTYRLGDESPYQIITFEKDERGRDIRIHYDNNANGQFDKGDARYEYVLDNLSNQRLTNKVTTFDSKGQEVIDNWRYTYDDYNRRVLAHKDDDENGQINGNEKSDIAYYLGESTQVTQLDVYFGTTIQQKNYFMFNDAQQQIAAIHNHVIDSRTEIIYGFYNGHRHSVEDYTDQQHQNTFEPFKGQISRIALSNNKVSTDITLDNDVVALLTKDTTLRIDGDATDTVRLKGYNEFTKVEGTQTLGSNTYDKLTTTVGDKEYTLLVDTDIHLFNADTNMEIV
ncbi:hypothetical protein, partial [Frederiksenia canicola]